MFSKALNLQRGGALGGEVSLGSIVFNQHNNEKKIQIQVEVYLSQKLLRMRTEYT